jgi:hypothetical protein
VRPRRSLASVPLAARAGPGGSADAGRAGAAGMGPRDATAAMAMEIDSWTGDWAWGLPLILLTVVVHAFGLLWLLDRLVPAIRRRLPGNQRRPLRFALVVGTTVLLLTALHALEAAAWAVVYLGLGALPDARTAMLYSLSAITSYGHAAIFLAPPWQMMGALQALNGMMLLGLSTAGLYFVVRSARASAPEADD